MFVASFTGYYILIDCYFWLKENEPEIYKSEVLSLGKDDDEIIMLYYGYNYGTVMGYYLRLHEIVSYANKYTSYNISCDDTDTSSLYPGIGYDEFELGFRRYKICYEWLKENRPELFDEESGRFVLPSELD